MFGITTIIAATIGEIRAQQIYHQAWQDWVKTLPPKEAKAERKRYAKEQAEKLAHYRAMEVAREGRSKNFWGSR